MRRKSLGELVDGGRRHRSQSRKEVIGTKKDAESKRPNGMRREFRRVSTMHARFRFHSSGLGRHPLVQLGKRVHLRSHCE